MVLRPVSYHQCCSLTKHVLKKTTSFFKKVDCNIFVPKKNYVFVVHTSRKHLRTKVTPDLHLTYSKTGEILGYCLNDKNGTFSIKSYVVAI